MKKNEEYVSGVYVIASWILAIVSCLATWGILQVVLSVSDPDRFRAVLVQAILILIALWLANIVFISSWSKPPPESDR